MILCKSERARVCVWLSEHIWLPLKRENIHIIRQFAVVHTQFSAVFEQFHIYYRAEQSV